MDRDVWHADIPNRCRSIRYFDARLIGMAIVESRHSP